FRMSSLEAKQAERSAEKISASVKKLEAIFGHMYQDTFSMMRDTYAEIRQHAWKAAELDTENTAEEIAVKVRDDAVEEVGKVLAKSGMPPGKVNELKAGVVPAIDQAIVKSRALDSVSPVESLKQRLLFCLERYGAMSVEKIRTLSLLQRFTPDEFGT